MRNWLFFLLIMLSACSALKVDYDYDAQTDFSSFQTYNYYPDMQTGLSELDTRRLLSALDSVLISKGFKSSEEPDFFINIESREFGPTQNSNVGVGIGGGGRNVGGGVSIGVPLGGSGIEREILFDFIDSQRDILFWQAISTSSYRENASPAERERLLRQIVIKVMSKYPPL
ncbi:MAG: DUF4136 domain-containing protein [Flavobacteriaceae bacterium]|nr:DUF4136 domain-containing protein [Muriicola sp.]NNC61082.1 DUF4136 domain-containing protein [Eudoraea sp.]NNK20913.1 DUF4136 domain-containing protein [Flavobacteriaceae bacterium]MBT8291158.1 DUF4136 domain-containing protein [Muriicola sp.]NNK36357.1 DUF4136 domain-containing protein [Eudoraea sp.]